VGGTVLGKNMSLAYIVIISGSFSFILCDIGIMMYVF
jgi:hypothetical protein